MELPNKRLLLLGFQLLLSTMYSAVFVWDGSENLNLNMCRTNLLSPNTVDERDAVFYYWLSRIPSLNIFPLVIPK